MTGKERITQALEHNKSDRMPLAYEAGWEVTVELIKYFQLDQREDSGVPNVSSFHSPTGERKDIVFYGAIDQQETLSYGSVQDVKNEVLQSIEILGKYARIYRSAITWIPAGYTR